METAQSVNVEKTNQVVKLAYLISGFVFVFLGVLGAFLPLLPTTIFLILASACFMKSSPRANAWLKNNKLLGSYLRNYQDKTGLTIASKITHIAVLWIGILISAYLLTDKTAIQVLLFMIAVGVTVHLVMIKTAR
jgi:uncharacterized membrane protein YbaN (DUF454 family)